MAAKIYSPNPNDCFPFVYYSGANNGMNKFFGPNKPNKVIRQLPGKDRDSVAYDYTDKEIPAGPKFAFYTMESRKSYTVTSEPVYGGTICYIPFDTEEQANKMKLFVENNPVFAEYVKRMKLRGHAFGLRHIRKFNIDQIVTGYETPAEWNIGDKDLSAPTIFENEITEDRDRVKALGEVFTPTKLVEFVLDLLEKSDKTAFSKKENTFIDSMCGDGQFLVGIKQRKEKHRITESEAVSTIYGIDLTQSNVDSSIRRTNGLEKNIVCADSLGETFTLTHLEEKLFEVIK